jgi:hypothetical protein
MTDPGTSGVKEVNHVYTSPRRFYGFAAGVAGAWKRLAMYIHHPRPLDVLMRSQPNRTNFV